MKKIILALSILISVSSISMVQGQNSDNRDNRRERRIHNTDDHKRFSHHRLFDNLTDEQKKEMEKIDANFEKERNTLSATKLTREEYKTKIGELRNNKRKAIDNILTDEQKKQRDERWAMARKAPNRKHDGRRPMMKSECPMQGEAPMSGCCPMMGKHPMSKKAPMAGRGGFVGGPRGTWIMAGIDLDDKQKEEYTKIAENYKKDIDKIQDKHRSERVDIDKKQIEAVKKILTDDQKKIFEENLKKREDNKPIRK